MDDKGEGKRKEAVENLQKIHNAACEEVESRKIEIQALLSEINDGDCGFDDIVVELDNLSNDFEEHLNHIEDLFQEAEITVHQLDNDTDPLQVVMQFRNKTISMRTQKSILLRRFREVKRSYDKRVKSTKRDSEYKDKLKQTLRNHYDQCCILIEDLNVKIKLECSFQEKFEDSEVMKKKLFPIQETILDMLTGLERKLKKCYNDIKNSCDKDTLKEIEKKFQNEKENLYKEISIQKQEIERIMQTYSVEVRTINKERNYKRQIITERLMKNYNSKQHLVLDCRREIKKWITSIQWEFEDKKVTQSKLDKLQCQLQELIQKLDQQLEITKSHIEGSNDALAEYECVATFKNATHHIMQEIPKIKLAIQNTMDEHFQRNNAKMQDKQRTIIILQESLINIRDDIKLIVKDIKNMIDCTTSMLQTREMTLEIQMIRDELKRQVDDLNDSFESSMAKTIETDLDTNVKKDISIEFQNKATLIETKLRMISNQCQKIDEQNLINLKKQEELIKQYQTIIEKIHVETISPAIKLKEEIEHMLTIEENINEKREIQQLRQQITTNINFLNHDCFTANEKIIHLKVNDVESLEEIKLELETKCKFFAFKIKDIYRKTQDFQDKNSKHVEKEQESILHSLTNLLNETQIGVDEVKRSIDQLLSQVDNNEHKKRLEDITVELAKHEETINQYFHDTKEKLMQTNLANLFDELLKRFFRLKRVIDSEVDELYDVVREMNDKHKKSLKIKHEIETSIQSLQKMENKVRITVRQFKQNLDLMITIVQCDRLKQELLLIQRKTQKQIDDMHRLFESTQQKIREPSTETFLKQALSDFDEKNKCFEQKIIESHDKVGSLVGKYAKMLHKKKEIQISIQNMYKSQKLILCQLDESIQDSLTGKFKDDYLDEDDLKHELNHVYIKLLCIIKDVDDEFQKLYSKIDISYQESVHFESLMLFRTISENAHRDVSILENNYQDITKRYKITKEAVLARFIRSTASQMGLQLEDQNSLNVFKLPLHETCSVPSEKLRRFELGQPVTGGEHRQIILVGMTGAGKSLLVNNIINYVYGVNFTDPFRFKLIVESEEIGERDEGASTSKADSMTSWVSSFTLHWQEGFRIPFSLTIIDTPGFGDTRGLKYDENIISQFKTFFGDEELCPNQSISSIGFLIQASQSRITVEQKYIFDQVLNMFGKDMMSKICILFTFADAQLPPALELVKSNGIPHSERLCFKFNNSAVYAPNKSKPTELAWNFGYFNLKQYFESLRIVQPISLSLTKHVLDEREQLRLSLENLQEKISNTMEMLSLIEEQSHTIVTINGTIQSKKDFKIKKQTYKCNLKVVKYPVTNCSRCNVTCHDRCDIAGDMKQECSAIINGFCTVCPSKCPWKMHTNGTNIYEYKPIIIEETIEDMRRDYNAAVEERNSKKTLLQEMLLRYSQKKKSIYDCIQGANQCFRRVEKISLRCSYLTHVEYIERLIESEEGSSRPQKDDRLIQLRHLKDMAETLRDVRNDPDNLPSRISNYQTKIAEIIHTIGDETIERLFRNADAMEN